MSNCLLPPWHKTFAKDFIIVSSWVQYIHAYNSILFSVPIQKHVWMRGGEFFPYLIKGAWRSISLIEKAEIQSYENESNIVTFLYTVFS